MILWGPHLLPYHRHTAEETGARGVMTSKIWDTAAQLDPSLSLVKRIASVALGPQKRLQTSPGNGVLTFFLSLQQKAHSVSVTP